MTPARRCPAVTSANPPASCPSHCSVAAMFEGRGGLGLECGHCRIARTDLGAGRPFWAQEPSAKRSFSEMNRVPLRHCLCVSLADWLLPPERPPGSPTLAGARGPGRRGPGVAARDGTVTPPRCLSPDRSEPELEASSCRPADLLLRTADCSSLCMFSPGARGTEK